MTVSAASNALIISDTESKLKSCGSCWTVSTGSPRRCRSRPGSFKTDTTYTVRWCAMGHSERQPTLGASSGTSAFKTGTTEPSVRWDFLINLPAEPPDCRLCLAPDSRSGKRMGPCWMCGCRPVSCLGLTKVVIGAKITTLDKRDAKIAQVNHPFQTTSPCNSDHICWTPTFELNVTPQITSRDPKEIGKQILMKVRATRNAVGARSNPAGPSIDRREATTPGAGA